MLFCLNVTVMFLLESCYKQRACVCAWMHIYLFSLYIIIITDLFFDCTRKWSLALRDMMSFARACCRIIALWCPGLVTKVKLRKANFMSITRNAKHAIKPLHGLFYTCQGLTCCTSSFYFLLLTSGLPGILNSLFLFLF